MIDKDIWGEAMPQTLWHGSTASSFPPTMSPAKGIGFWNVIDHQTYLDPQFDENDPDQRSELDSDLRLAYGNIVYDAFQHSNDPKLKALADEKGLYELGSAVSILFVSDDEEYAKSWYGPTNEIDFTSPGILAAVPDDNINRGGCWLLVLQAGSPFPFKLPTLEEDFSGPQI